MTFTAQQERPMAHHPQPEADAGPSAHEIKYRHDAAHYVASMLTELRQMAGKAGFEKLVTALEAAYYEAYAAKDSHARPPSAEEQEKISPAKEQTGQ